MLLVFPNGMPVQVTDVEFEVAKFLLGKDKGGKEKPVNKILGFAIETPINRYAKAFLKTNNVKFSTLVQIGSGDLLVDKEELHEYKMVDVNSNRISFSLAEFENYVVRNNNNLITCVDVFRKTSNRSAVYWKSKPFSEMLERDNLFKANDYGTYFFVP